MMGIAVWGLGPHAMKNVLPAIEAADGLRLAGVCSRDPAKREEASRRWGGQTWADPAEMLASDAVEIVYVATPTGLHAAQGRRVIEAKRHLVCDKSLTASVDDALELCALAARSDVVLCEAMMFLYHPRFETIRRVVGEGALGSILHAFCWFGLPPLENPGFRTSRALGGGALLDVGCYPVAMARGLFGGDAAVLRSRITNRPGSDVDTGGDATIAFGDAVVGMTWGYDRAYGAELTIIGDQQTLYANRVFAKGTEGSEVWLRDRNGRPSRLDVPHADGFVSMFASVTAAVSDPTLRAGLRHEAEAQARLLAEISLRAEDS